MKSRTPFCLKIALGIICLCSIAVPAELEFAGYLTTHDGPRFIVTNLSEPKTSELLALGRSFLGYVLKEFDGGREVLVVERDGQRTELSLKASRIRRGESDASRAVEFVVLVSPDGTIANANGEPLTFATVEATARSITKGSRKLHLMLVVPRMPAGTDAQKMLDTARGLMRMVPQVAPKGSSCELVNVDAALVTPSKR